MIAEQRGLPGSDRPLRVLWLIKELGAGGAERLVEQSARYRDPTLVEPAVASLLVEKSTLVESLEKQGCKPVECLDPRSSWDRRWTLRLHKLLLQNDFDVLRIHSPLAASGTRLAIRTLPRRKRPRIVVTEHNFWSSHSPLTVVSDGVEAVLVGPLDVPTTVATVEGVYREIVARETVER